MVRGREERVVVVVSGRVGVVTASTASNVAIDTLGPRHTAFCTLGRARTLAGAAGRRGEQLVGQPEGDGVGPEAQRPLQPRQPGECVIGAPDPDSRLVAHPGAPLGLGGKEGLLGPEEEEEGGADGVRGRRMRGSMHHNRTQKRSGRCGRG